MEKYRDVIDKFISQARSILGSHFVKAVLYGSRARGDASDTSDFDLMFLTTSAEEEIRKEESALYDVAFDYLMEYGVDISVIVKNISHYQYWLGALPFYDNIEREGVVLSG